MATGTILPPAQAFGIGTPKQLTNSDTLSSISEPGLYVWAQDGTSPSDIPFTYGRMIVIGRGATEFTQYYFNYDTGAMCSRRWNNGSWETMRWTSPPMVAGTEYLLSEQYLGNDVYCKTITDSVTADVDKTFIFASGRASRGLILRHNVFGQLSSTNWIQTPFVDTNNTITSRAFCTGSGTPTLWSLRIVVSSNKDLSNVNATLWYTKG